MNAPVPVYDPSQVDLDPGTLPLDALDVSNPYLFESNVQEAWFRRLRDEAPIHYCPDSPTGPYWSVTRYEDIMAVDLDHETFSSEPTIVIRDPDDDFKFTSFITMDPPLHEEQRGVVSPVASAANVRNFETLIRERTVDVLDHLPVGEEFNWVEHVSIELTTRMLATLFDFPFEDRRKLTYWSDVSTTVPGLGLVQSEEERRAVLLECLEYFTGLWRERADKPPANDLISMLSHGEATRDMEPMNFLGNLILLIVGGNDTTRNTMSASVLALHDNPGEFQKLVDNQELIPSMVSETIRWHTPLAYMRRTATRDTELGGKTIRKGDKVLMWYVSGNRDERFFERPHDYIIDRADVRKHLSFGFGIHRCMGNRLAEMQLAVLWQEILKRFERVEVVGEPQRVPSSFVHGFSALPVVLHPRA